jgi:prophage antirepressor-like protein
MYFLDKIIKSDFGEIFIAKDEEQETYFMAKNICHILELVDEIKRTVSRLDDDEHILIKRNNITPISCMQDYLQAQNLGGGLNPPPKIQLTKEQFNTYGEQFVTESGLYHLVLLSRSTKAKDFKRWIIHEVLPCIRKLTNIPQEEAFTMLNKQRQKDAMKQFYIFDKNANFPKINNQVNYITSRYCGLDKTISKSEMPLEIKDIRQNVMDNYVELASMNNKFNLGLDVYQTLKTKYNIK